MKVTDSDEHIAYYINELITSVKCFIAQIFGVVSLSEDSTLMSADKFKSHIYKLVANTLAYHASDCHHDCCRDQKIFDKLGH